METYNYKAEERKRYLKYFLVWIILAVLSATIFGVMLLTHKDEEPTEPVRNNDEAPAQRVYDYAEVLTDQEEEKLEELIAEYEERGKCDLILVTIDEYVGVSDSEWDYGMVNRADDFYDQKAFGYDKPHGDGALLLDNWYHVGEYDSQAGSWLSTSGKLEWAIGESEERSVFRAFDSGYNTSPFEAYSRALEKVADISVNYEGKEKFRFPWFFVILAPMIIAGIYAAANMHQAPGKDTTTAMTYVPGGQPALKASRDDFLRKTVTKVKIETSSSSRSGGGGSYGHHTSHGGYSHGGGGHRR